MSIARNLEHLAEIGKPIECREMTLLAGDHDPPIVVGSGVITPASPSRFDYEMHGTPEDIGHALSALRRLEADPYDGTLRSRLTATTEAGEDLLCGWTLPSVKSAEDKWTFSGDFEAISTHDEGEFEPLAECIFLLPKSHIARTVLRRMFGELGAVNGASKMLNFLGSDIVLELDDVRDELRVIVAASEALPPHYAENWIGEPLRILFGEPIYPRYVARRSSDWSMNWIRPSPEWDTSSDHVALWQGPGDLTDIDRFWRAFERLLTHTAQARDKNGNPHFEANPLTSLYGELIAASRGSRWVWALTFASVSEGILNIIGAVGSPHTDLSREEREALSEDILAFQTFLADWQGNPDLVEAAKAAVARKAKTSAAQALRALRNKGIITKCEYAAWDTLRNRVMHGRLVSPYSSEKDDKLLLDLASLVRSLTWHLIDMPQKR